MRTYVGDDDSLWKPMPGYFTPGTPLYTEEGGEILKGSRKLDAAKKLLAESGYAGQPVTLLAAQDIPSLKGWGDVTADLLKRLGMKVDLAAIDWGTVVARRLNKAALDDVVYAPLGWYLNRHAWRKNVTGIVPGPLPFFWGVSKMG